jgi:YggT family protein
MLGTMLQIVQLVAEVVIDFITLMLLARFFMQWQRVSFRNQAGAFVIAVTDWVVLPLRRIVPGLFGLDLASLLSAWAAQTLLVLIGFALVGWSSGGVVGVLLGALGLGLVGLGIMIVWLISIIVMAAAVMSWFAPHLPAVFILDALSRPFLAPFRRVIRPVSGIDLSPLVLILLLQIVLLVLKQIGAGFLPLLSGF